MARQARAAPHDFGELLTSEQQYRMEVAQLPRLTKAQEQEVAARAQAGEDVRDTVLLSLQPRLFTLASRYARSGSTWLDLCQSASLAMLESYQQAITKQNPFAYLLGVARLAMIGCISGRDDLIKTHHHHQSVSVLSLDRPLVRGDGADGDLTLADMLTGDQHEYSLPEQELDYSLLYQAIAALPVGLRLVIEQHYGFGCAPQSLNAISLSLAKATAVQQNAPECVSRKTSNQKSPSVAHARKRHAIALMQRLLATSTYVRGEQARTLAEVQQ